MNSREHRSVRRTAEYSAADAQPPTSFGAGLAKSLRALGQAGQLPMDVIRQLPAPVFFVHYTGLVAYANDAAEDVYGTDLVGEHLQVVLAPFDALRTAQQTGKEVGFVTLSLGRGHDDVHVVVVHDPDLAAKVLGRAHRIPNPPPHGVCWELNLLEFVEEHNRSAAGAAVPVSDVGFEHSAPLRVDDESEVPPPPMWGEAVENKPAKKKKVASR